MIFQPFVEELLTVDYPVHPVNRVIKHLNNKDLIESYNAKGKQSYKPESNIWI